MIFEKDELKILWPFYLNKFLIACFFFIAAFWVVYFNDIGLNFKQISIILTVFFTGSLLFEIPTGAFADAYGRKASVIIGNLGIGIALFLIPYFNSFFHVLFLMLMWGISATFISGAEEAWVIDLLKTNKKKKLIKDYFIKTGSLSSLGLIIAGIIGSIFVKYLGLKSIWTVSGLIVLISTLFLLKPNDTLKRKTPQIKKLYSEINKNVISSIKFGVKHPVLFYLILASIFFEFAMITEVAWQPFFRTLNIPIYVFGYIMSGSAVLLVVTPFLSKPLLSLIKKENIYLAVMSLINSLILISVILVVRPSSGILLFLLSVIPNSLKYSVEADYFNEFIPNKIRASVISFKYMVIGVTVSFAMLVSGPLLDYLGPKITLMITGFLMIPSVIFYSMVSSRENEKIMKRGL